MSDDKPLKSAYDLAMERLRAQDRAEGIEQSEPLSEEQKAAIAELRSKARARQAEVEILHRKDVAAAAGDPEKLEELQEHYETDRRRIQSALESDIARIRRNAPADDD